MKKILRFFDKLEDDVRGWLSKHNFLYAFVGGVAIVIFWRGVWITADSIPFLTGPVSIFISVFVLLVTGLFVSFFVGNDIILSGLKHEKRLDEKVVDEVKTELDILIEIQNKIGNIEQELKTIRNEISSNSR